MLLPEIHTGITVLHAQILAVLSEAECSVAVIFYRPDIHIRVSGQSSICPDGNICACVIEILIRILLGRQRLVVCRRIDNYLIAVLKHGFSLYGIGKLLHCTHGSTENRHRFQRTVFRNNRLIFGGIQFAGCIVCIRRITAVQRVINLRVRRCRAQGDFGARSYRSCRRVG